MHLFLLPQKLSFQFQYFLVSECDASATIASSLPPSFGSSKKTKKRFFNSVLKP
jgi:hypothetical protein